MSKSNIVMDIPGGLYGNNAGFLPVYPKDGHVVVDVRDIDKALRWLRRRAGNIRTSQQAQNEICIEYTLP